jgi:type IV pilus assembly protein PilW
MTMLYLPGRQAGFSLIELMVSMVIGLVITLAVIGAYLSASGAARVAEATGRMNEDAQAALTILTQQLRMAGVNPSQSDRNTTTLHNLLANPYAIRGCDTTFSDVKTAASASALTCPSGTGASSISIGYEADKYNTIPTSAGVPTDCLGSGLTASTAMVTATKSDNFTTVTVTVYEAENRFFIGTSTSIVNPSLYCKGNAASTNAQPLVENIEDLKITYGASNPGQPASYGDNSPGVTPNFVLGYLTASELTSDSSSLAGTLPGFAASFTLNGLATGAEPWKAWGAVKTVRVCVLVRSENRAVFDTPARYIDCTGVLVTSPDLRMRRAYTATVVLRNR